MSASKQSLWKIIWSEVATNPECGCQNLTLIAHAYGPPLHHRKEFKVWWLKKKKDQL